MTERIRLEVGGRTTEAAVALPKGEGKHGAVIVVHEWHGLNHRFTGMAERLAEEGFVAIAPDLYFGEVASDDARAYELMQAMKTDTSLEIFGAASAWAKAHPRCNGHVAILGFCMGGAMAFAASTRLDGLSCAVPFYGLPPGEYLEAGRIGCPIQAHFAKQDDWARADKAEEFAAGAKAAGKQMELFVYDAGHAFMRADDASKFDAAAAKTAWPRTTKFLHQHLG